MPATEHGGFTYVTVQNAALYRRVMLAFVAAKRRFTVHLRPEDVREAMEDPVPLEVVADALQRLEDWGNLRSDPDTSRVTTVEDFHRARYLYQLTRIGEAVEDALATYDEAFGRRGALQAIALADVATQLRALSELAGHESPDAAKVHLCLRALVDRFSDLADNAQAFMGSLQRSIDLHDADAEAFRAYKDQLIDYLQRFVRDLVATGSEIAALITGLERRGVDGLLDLAAGREAEDAAPGPAAPDAGVEGAGPSSDPRAEEFVRRRASWHERWAGFRGWFLSDREHPSQARLLRSQARAAIPQLLQVVEALNERRTGRSDRSADFRTLARWFAEAPDDAAMHRLWRVAFGLSPSRHLSVDADSLAQREDHPVPAHTPWASAPPLLISPRLRRTGSYERRGRPNRVVDRVEYRRHLAERVTREAEQAAAARAVLATGRTLRLGDLAAVHHGELDREVFALFLRLLGDALTARAPGRREVTTTTSDGTLRITLTALDNGRTVTIPTSDGRLSGPDHLVSITDVTQPVDEERSA